MMSTASRIIILYQQNLLATIKGLIYKMSYACKDHGQAIFVRSFDGLLVTDGAS